MKRLTFFFVVASLIFIIPVSAKAKLKIISRQEWGANESLTLYTENEKLNLSEAEEDAGQNPIEEQDPEIAHITERDDQGHPYLWPLQYAKDVKFIVIHYTGLPNELPDSPKQEMRNIFRSHAIGRGWGDIGYHFLIDRKGRVYEGRKGGPFVIGGHAVPVNKVSIGISLMGNYNEEDVPPAMLESTVELLRELTKQYKIKPLGKTEYNGKIYSNIHGHEDNSAKQDPGLYFQEKFQLIRKLVSRLRRKEIPSNSENYDFKKMDRGKFINGLPNESTDFTIRIKNTGKRSWNRKTHIENTGDPLLPRVLATLDPDQKRVPPGGLGIFRGALPDGLASGMRLLDATVVMNGSVRTVKTFPVPIIIPAEEKPVRVALGFKGKKPKLKSEHGMQLFSDEKLMAEFAPYEDATVARLKKGGYRVRTKTGKIDLDEPPRFLAKNRGILEIVNYENRPAWNPKLNDNLFRGTLEIWKINGQLMVINELPLEDYLKGIAEVSNSDPEEKIKTIIILARSYAKYYRDQARKFPGKPYDLDDDPNHTQKYIGYGLELRSPNIIAAVKATRGKIVKYQGKSVITPYFNQSDGRTRSAEEVWGWKNTPYLQSVPDTFCETTELKGHGVGLSGCGATALARQGKTAEEIIEYYYRGIEITGGK